MSGQAKDLIIKLLAQDPAKRPTARVGARVVVMVVMMGGRGSDMDMDLAAEGM